MTRWLKDVELRLDSSTFGGLEVFRPLEGFQSQSFFQLLAFSFFCGTLKPELFLFCQPELSVLFSFLGVLLLSLNFSFLSFESCLLLGVQFLQSEQLLLRKLGLSLRFLTEALSLSLITFLFQAPFLCFTSSLKLFELLLAGLLLLRFFPLFFMSFLVSSALELELSL